MLKVTFGQKLPKPQVERFKGTKEHDAIISIITKEGIQGVALHYEPGVGSFHCFEGQCCVDCGAARIYYILPILVYHIKDRQSLTVDLTKKAEIKVLRLGEEAYTKLIKKDEIRAVDTYDLLVITEDEKFQRYVFEAILDRETGAPKPQAWRMDNNMRLAVMKEYQTRYASLIEGSMGRVFNPESYEAAKIRAAQNKPTPTIASSQTPSIPQKPNFDAALADNSAAALPYPSLGGVIPEVAPSSSYTPPPVDEVTEEDLMKLIG